MFPLTLLTVRLTWIFFLFVSFWPWEKDENRIKKSSFEIPHEQALLRTVRVALFYEKSEVLIGASSQFQMNKFPENEALAQGANLPPTPIRPSSSGIQVGSIVYPVSGLRISSQSKEVQVGKKKYHDTIQVLKNPLGSLTVVNEIDLEDYLQGVLPWEMNPEWPKDALKAQAVISRTYAIFMNIENKEYPFAMSADVGSQVYGGKTAEKFSSNRAVQETRGQILTYRGKIFPTFFHSTCGGRTTRSDYQWKIESHPSLQGVECSFCRSSKHFFWKADFSASEVQNLLGKKGFRVSEITGITLDQFDSSGRPRFFIVKHSNGSLSVPVNEFRLALGPDRMRSAMVKVTKSGDKFHFEGRGWGHGVGLCQFGAKHLAELGYRYTDILRYYYPESEIRNIEDFLIPDMRGTPVSEKGNVFKRWYNDAKEYIEDL